MATDNSSGSPTEVKSTLSAGTHRILQVLIGRWAEASRCESDPREHEAFQLPIDAALAAKTAADLRALEPLCTGYPNWGRYTVHDLAVAEEAGKTVTFFEREDGAVRWEIES